MKRFFIKLLITAAIAGLWWGLSQTGIEGALATFAWAAISFGCGTLVYRTWKYV